MFNAAIRRKQTESRPSLLSLADHNLRQSSGLQWLHTRFPALQRLGFGYSSCLHDEHLPLVPLPALQHLIIAGCHSFTGSSVAAFAQLRSLKLWAAEGVSNDTLMPCLAALTSLMALEVSECDGITGKGLSRLTRLSVLRMDYAAYGMNSEVFQQLSSLTGLRELAVTRKRDTPYYCDAFMLPSLQGLSALQRLDLRGGNLLESPDAMERLPALQFLNVVQAWGHKFRNQLRASGSCSWTLCTSHATVFLRW